eukprot:7601646-Lingulodinium_polyedra.AAC.1
MAPRDGRLAARAWACWPDPPACRVTLRAPPGLLLRGVPGPSREAVVVLASLSSWAWARGAPAH